MYDYPVLTETSNVITLSCNPASILKTKFNTTKFIESNPPNLMYKNNSSKEITTSRNTNINVTKPNLRKKRDKGLQSLLGCHFYKKFSNILIF